MVRARRRFRLAVAVAVAVAVLASCGGSGSKGSVPTVTFAGGGSTTAPSAGAGPSTTTGSGVAASSTAVGTTTAPTLAPTSAPSAATTTAASGSTTLTTGTLASLPAGATEASVPGVSAETAQAAIAGYQAWLEALRVVGSNPAAPPWDRLRATMTAFGYPQVKKQFEDTFALGQSWVIVDAGVSRARIESSIGPPLLEIDDCQTEWSYKVDTATGTPVAGQEAAAAGPTNTGYHVKMVLEGGSWRVDGYDATRSELCAGI